MAQTVKNPPAIEIQVQFLVWEDPLEKGMAAHSSEYSCLENSMDRGAWWATAHGVTKSQTRLSLTHAHTHTWIELLCFLFALFLLATLCSTWDLSSQTRDPTASCAGRQRLNSWTIGEVPRVQFLIQSPGHTVSMLYDNDWTSCTFRHLATMWQCPLGRYTHKIIFKVLRLTTAGLPRYHDLMVVLTTVGK